MTWCHTFNKYFHRIVRASPICVTIVLYSWQWLVTLLIENDSFPLSLGTTWEPGHLGSGALSTRPFSLLSFWGSGKDPLGVCIKGSSGPGTVAGSSSSSRRSSSCTSLEDFILLEGFFALLKGFFGLGGGCGGFSMIVTVCVCV